MAQSHRHENAVAVDTVNDSDIYMGLEGHVGRFPMPDLSGWTRDALEAAAIQGLQGSALRRVQPLVKKAIADKKTPDEVRAEANKYLADFAALYQKEVSENKGYKPATIADKRADLARDLIRDLAVKAGKPMPTDATVEKNLGAFLAHPRHSLTVQGKVDEWLAAVTPKKARAKAGEETAESFNLDEI